MNERQPTHLDLFSGIGGFSLAFEAEGFQTIGFAEIDPYASAVLKRHWPDVPNYGDVRQVPRIECEIITGGFPCQPFSVSGKRRGKNDDRYLWPSMLEIIKKCNPTFVLCENVPGIVGLELEHCLTDLEGEGFWTITFSVPACAVGAPIERDRIWIIACSDKINGKAGLGNFKQETPLFDWPRTSSENIWLQAASKAIGVDDGLSAGSYADRVGSLGNAIVPQVAQIFARAIKEALNND